LSEFAISARGLGKQYRLRDLGGMSELAAKVARRLGGKKQEAVATHFWALDDVSFDIRKGEVVGILGHNGAGKSTLLKILTRITNPTVGTASVHGRVGMLLEVGTGFHEDLTGQENVYLGGAILGMTRAEIHEKYEDIVAFAEMDGFMDLAVRHYSSGMKLRLALSVAIHLDAEVIFLDEIWAVGDHAFQLKTWHRIEELIASGRTFVIVAHNLETIARLCTRCLLLDHGRLTMDGSPAEVIAQYRLELRQRSQSQGAAVESPMLQSIDIAGAQLAAENLAMGDLLDCRVTLMAQRPGHLKMAAMIRDNWGKAIAAGEAEHGRWTSVPVGAGRTHFRCQLPVALPAVGAYELVIQIAEGDAMITTELPFTVVEREMLVKDEHGQDQAVPALPVIWESDEDTQAATVRLVTSG
jgi:ABC-type polysaccharide/polyol phosphate transport system ATPase subunit